MVGCSIRAGVLAALVAFALAGCGRRGELEPAPDPAVPVVKSSEDSNGLVGRRTAKVPITPPHQPFVLDPLL